MKKSYSAKKLISSLNKLGKDEMPASWLIANGWTVQTSNIYDNGMCAEVKFAHPLYDQIIEICTDNKFSTEHIIRSVHSFDVEEILLRSKTMNTIIENAGAEAA